MTYDLDFSDIRKFPPELVEGIIVLRFRNLKIQDLIAIVSQELSSRLFPVLIAKTFDSAELSCIVGNKG